MVSKISLINFVLINTTLLLIGSIQNYLNNNLLFIILRNSMMVLGIDYITHQKENFKIKEKYYCEFLLDLIKSSIIEYLIFIIIDYFNIEFVKSSTFDILYFIPLSFIFEVIFDLFHYLSHRLLHTKLLYFIHKHHHDHINLKPIIAFHQNSFDLLITNTIPFLLALFIVTKFIKISKIVLSLLDVYKVYTEICGHCGKNNKTPSFPQCIWLPKILGIDLYFIDHHKHHLFNNCNFAKRFSLWDKFFGTIK